MFQDIKPTGGRERRSASSAGPGSWLLGLLLVAVLGYAAVRVVGGGGATTAAAGPAPAEAHRPTGPAEVVGRDTLRRGVSLGTALRRQGLSGRDYAEVLDRVREHASPRRLHPGLEVQVAARVPERASRVVLELDRDRSLLVDRTEEGWRARVDSVPVVVDSILVGGVIESSLWGAQLFGDTARLVPNEDNEIILRLAEIYAWQVDFFRDIRYGDAFRVLVEREMRPDGSMRRGRMLAAEFVNAGRRLPAVRFAVPDGPVEYYDDEGEATRKAFLRAPLRYQRVTSGFSRRRYHPVLRRHRAHRGVDYGAPRGTPVWATGGGVVTRAGRWGGYGVVVEIRHTPRFRTRYAHLRSVARGIRPGARVEQKQVIGYVGATGLATGPHVHYEFLVNGTQRNPSSVELPPGDPVPAEYRETYRTMKDERLGVLRELRFPSEVQVAELDEEEATGP